MHTEIVNRMIGNRWTRVRQLPVSFIVGAIIVSAFVGVGLISFFWTPYDPIVVDVAQRYSPPDSDSFLLGSDRLGRDVVTQLMIGARTSLVVAITSTIAGLLGGVLLGLTAAGSRPTMQRLISRASDAAIAIPSILVALVLATVMNLGSTVTIIALTVWFVPLTARVVIGPARQIIAREFVEAAFGYGRSRRFVLSRHVLPNIAPPLIVHASLLFPAAILIEAALSFLGVGAQRPDTSWGVLILEGKNVLSLHPYLTLFPTMAIIITTLGFNLVGDGLRALLDPRAVTGSSNA